jgi:hypothetical protein
MAPKLLVVMSCENACSANESRIQTPSIVIHTRDIIGHFRIFRLSICYLQDKIKMQTTTCLHTVLHGCETWKGKSIGLRVSRSRLLGEYFNPRGTKEQEAGRTCRGRCGAV